MVLVRGTVPDTRPGEQPQDLGLIIRRLRNAGVAQADMARHLGRNREVLRLWERATGG